MHSNAVIGTYTEHGSEGLYSCDVAIEGSVSMERRSLAVHQEHPTYLATHPDEPFLYTVHEIDDGQVSSYRIDDTGSLMKRNQQPCGAAGPCYCSVHPSGRYLFVAQYAGGAVSMLPIRSDGTLSKPVDIVEHEGSGPNRDRQKDPHPHAAVCGPNGTFLYVPDLGIDEVVIYEIDDANSSLVHTGSVATQPGAGPRHLDFHPTKPFAYLITELDSTIVAYRWDESTGTLGEIGTIPTLPAAYDGANQPSEIVVHPSGEWVYGANRGHDSIAVSTVQADGCLEFIETLPTGGEWPRYFVIDPTGEILFVQNRKSDDVVPFRINLNDGTLAEIEGRLAVPAPSCMVF
jgi:6-phosphogluconolactonase